ncbi:MAG: type II secretion system protein [Phycisphaerales bacterium]|nr:type II secretion system protein [Phycisphaerales bacterium]
MYLHSPCRSRRSGGGPRRPWATPAFTLIEILIVVVILGVLAAIVIPKFLESDRISRTNILSNTVRYIQQMVVYYRQTDDFDHAPSGYPADIEPSWFRSSALPRHTWTNQPISVEIVDGPSNQHYPGTKTFSLADDGAYTAWYNRTNGRFVVLIPAQESDDDTLAVFNAVNLANCSSLSDTD